MDQSILIAAARYCTKRVGCTGCPMEAVEHCQRTLLTKLADALENKQREADAARKAKNAVTNAVPSMNISERQEKREILERLQKYRNKFGMGAYGRLARLSEGKLTSETIRAMAMGEKYDIATWRILKAAIEKAEESNNG
jgi:hypothetical protein